jgi:predicted DNA-binding transcriptional regulator
MKAHKGMRPQDIVILLYLIDLNTTDWKVSDVAKELKISQSEVSEALQRCQIAKLLDKKHKKVLRKGLLEFVLHGLKYVFPVVPGALVRGVPTAHAAPPLSEQIVQGPESFVWPDAEGTHRGQEVTPLYKTVPAAVANKPGLYALLALCDAIRIGRAREVNLAREALTQRILAHG